MDIEELLRQLQANMDDGLMSQLYAVASVRPDEIIIGLRSAGVDVYTLREIAHIPTEHLDPFAEGQIISTRRSSALSGASFGFGGLLSVAPEVLYMMTTLLRLAQRMSLTYGYEVDSQRGRLDLWTTLGHALGIQLDLEGLESDLYKGLPTLIGRGRFKDPLLLKIAQKVLMAIALRMTTRFTRFIPVVGAGVGGVTNYAYFSKVGHSLKDDYRARHQLRALTELSDQQPEEIPFTLTEREG